MHAQQTLIPYLKGDLYGVSNEEEKIVLKPEYQDLIIANEKKVILTKKDGLWGAMNFHGDIILPHVVEIKGKLAASDIIPALYQRHEKQSNILNIYPHLFKIKADNNLYFFNPYAPKDSVMSFQKIPDSKIGGSNKSAYSSSGKNLTYLYKRVYTKNGRINFIDSIGNLIFPEGIFDGYLVSNDFLVVKNEKLEKSIYNTSGQMYINYSDFYRIQLSHTRNHLIVQKSFNHYIVMDSLGNIVMEGDYEALETNDKYILRYKAPYQYQLIDYKGNLIFECKDCNVSFLADYDQYFVYQDINSENNGKGIIDTSKSIIVDCKYKRIKSSPNRVFLEGEQDLQMLDSSLKEVYSNTNYQIQKIYSEERYYQGFIIKGEDSTNVDLYGFIDFNGNAILSPKYNDLKFFYAYGLFKVSTDSGNALINYIGDTLIDFCPHKIAVEEFHDIASVRVGRKNIHFNREWEKTKETGRNDISRLKTGRSEDKHFLTNSEDKIVSKYPYSRIKSYNSDYSGRLIYVCEKLDDKDRYVDIYNARGELIIPEGYGVLKEFLIHTFGSIGGIRVYNISDIKNNRPKRVGVINFDGEWIINPEVQLIYISSSKIFATIKTASSDLKLYSRKGELLSDVDYDLFGEKSIVTNIHNERMIVGYNIQTLEKLNTVAPNAEIDQKILPTRLLGYINMNGEEVIAPRYLDAAGFYNGIAEVSFYEGDSLHSGIIDTMGNFILNTPYDKVNVFSSNPGYLYTKNDGMYGLMNIEGEEIFEPKFKYVNEHYEIPKIIILQAPPDRESYIFNQDTTLNIGKISSFGKNNLNRDTEYYCLEVKLSEEEAVKAFYFFTNEGQYINKFYGQKISVCRKKRNFDNGLPLSYLYLYEDETNKPYIINIYTGQMYVSK